MLPEMWCPCISWLPCIWEAADHALALLVAMTHANDTPAWSKFVTSPGSSGISLITLRTNFNGFIFRLYVILVWFALHLFCIYLPGAIHWYKWSVPVVLWPDSCHCQEHHSSRKMMRKMEAEALQEAKDRAGFALSCSLGDLMLVICDDLVPLSFLHHCCGSSSV